MYIHRHYHHSYIYWNSWHAPSFVGSVVSSIVVAFFATTLGWVLENLHTRKIALSFVFLTVSLPILYHLTHDHDHQCIEMQLLKGYIILNTCHGLALFVADLFSSQCSVFVFVSMPLVPDSARWRLVSSQSSLLFLFVWITSRLWFNYVPWFSKIALNI